MKLSHTLAAPLAGLALLCAPAAASAATALQFLGFGSTFTNFDTVDTVGWTFTANNNLSVTKLGWFVTAPQLNGFHDVGIWNASGTLLGSGTVLNGPATGDGFRYVSTLAAPFTLASGQNYFIGGVDTSFDNDSYISGLSFVVTNPAITFRGAARAPLNTTGLVFPDFVQATNNGRFGPTFQFDVLPDAPPPPVDTAVPEPATWAMMILGFGLAGAAMRRRDTLVRSR